MKELGITKGEWIFRDVVGAGKQIQAEITFKADCGEYILKDTWQPIFVSPFIQFEPKQWREMQEANFKFIAEAGTVANETNMMPREMLESLQSEKDNSSKLFGRCMDLTVANKELLKALREANEIVKQYVSEGGGCSHGEGVCYCSEKYMIKRNEELISKADPK